MNNETLVSHIEKVQKALAGLAYTSHFDMGDWLELGECGTTLCLAGIAGALQLQLDAPTPDALNDRIYLDNYYKALNTVYGEDLLHQEIRKLACQYLQLDPSNDTIFFVDSWPQVLKQLYHDNKLWPRGIALKEINDVFTTLFPERLFTLTYFRCLAGYLALEFYKRQGAFWWMSGDNPDNSYVSFADFASDYQDIILKFDQLTRANESK
jgi:hypothetical protein